jgi:hypothetical protein
MTAFGFDEPLCQVRWTSTPLGAKWTLNHAKQSQPFGETFCQAGKVKVDAPRGNMLTKPLERDKA